MRPLCFCAPGQESRRGCVECQLDAGTVFRVPDARPKTLRVAWSRIVTNFGFMLAHTILSLAFASAPTYQPPPLAVVDEYTTQDGHRTRWASVTYTLPDGETAEAVLVVDDADHGDGYLYVDGEAVAHSSWGADTGVTNWTSSDPAARELAKVALDGLGGEAGNELLDAFAGDSQAFKCSAWGKKVLRAGKYIWVGVVASTTAACCGATAPGCILCAGAGAAAGAMGADALEGYCD